MELTTRVTNGVATRAEGALAHCGPDSGGFELSYTCQGPACSSLDGSLQNVMCHRDGHSTFICSNNVKCQPGTSTYQSNFTFSQNEPDPWSPTTENKPDIWVPQDQHVMVGACARFSLSSIGVEEGTHLVDAENTCTNMQHLSTPNALAGHKSTSTDRPQVGATKRPLLSTNKGARRNVSRSSFLVTLLFALITLLPGAQALINHHQHNELRRTGATKTRATSDGPQAFAEGLIDDLAEKARNQGAIGEQFAINLVAGIVSSVCQEDLEGSSPKAFNPEILNSCVASVYSGKQLPQPALRFLAVVGGSILCNYIVSETWPNGEDFVPDVCEGMQHLVDGLRTDATTPIDLASTAAELSTTRVESPGIFLPDMSTPSTQASEQPISVSSQPRLIPSTRSVKTSGSNNAVADPLSSSAISSSSLSTASPLVGGSLSLAVTFDASGSVGLPKPEPFAATTAGASRSPLQSTRPPNSSGNDRTSTGQASDRASTTSPVRTSGTSTTSPGFIELLGPVSSVRMIATPASILFESERLSNPPDPILQSTRIDSTELSLTTSMQFGSLSTASFVSNVLAGINSVTSRLATISTVATPDLSFDSKQITSAQEASPEDPTKSDLSVSGQGSSIQQSAAGQGGTTVFSGPAQKSPSRLYQDAPEGDDVSNAPAQSDLLRSLSLKQTSSVSPFISAIRSTAVSLPVALKLSSESYQTSSAQRHASRSPIENDVLASTQDFSMDSSASGQRDSAGAPEPMQTTTSESNQGTPSEADFTRAPTQSEFSRSLMLVQSASGNPSASTQGQKSATVEPIQATIAPLQTTIAANILPTSQPSPSPVQATDRPSSGSTEAERTWSNGVPSSSSPIRVSLQGVQTFKAISPSAVGAPIHVQAVTGPFNSSVTISLASEDQLPSIPSSPEVTSTSANMATVTLLVDASAHHAPSEGSVLFTPADLSTNTQAIDDHSLTLSGSEVSKVTRVDNTASIVAASIVTSFLTTSTAAASLARVAASKWNVASLLPISSLSPITATDPFGSSGGTINPESGLGPVSSPFADSSTIISPLGVFIKTIMMSTTSLSSASTRGSRSLDHTVDLLSSASANSTSLSHSPGSRNPSIHDGPMKPVASATSSISFAPLNPVLSKIWPVASPITSSSFQALKAESPLANMSMPFGSLGSGNFSPSSSKSTAPATVPSTLLSSATTVLTSSYGSTAPILFESTPTEGGLPITPPVANVGSASYSSHTTPDTSPDWNNLTTSCAQNSSTPNFCPGIGCVSLMTDKAHCGACNQACIHLCYQGACVCPDLLGPKETAGCDKEPIPVVCRTGHDTSNGSRVCTPVDWPLILGTSTLEPNRSSTIRPAILSVSSSSPTGSPLLLATVSSVETSDSEPTGCPPSLPDVCNGVCFNTKSEHNHCGGCGNFCSGTCVAGSCLAMSTRSSPQLASTGRMVTTRDLPVTTPGRPTSTSSVQAVVVYIWRGLAGPQQA